MIPLFLPAGCTGKAQIAQPPNQAGSARRSSSGQLAEQVQQQMASGTAPGAAPGAPGAAPGAPGAALGAVLKPRIMGWVEKGLQAARRQRCLLLFNPTT